MPVRPHLQEFLSETIRTVSLAWRSLSIQHSGRDHSRTQVPILFRLSPSNEGACGNRRPSNRYRPVRFRRIRQIDTLVDTAKFVPFPLQGR